MESVGDVGEAKVLVLATRIRVVCGNQNVTFGAFRDPIRTSDEDSDNFLPLRHDVLGIGTEPAWRFESNITV